MRQKLPLWLASLSKFDPQVVPTGPVMENVDSGKDIDLSSYAFKKIASLSLGVIEVEIVYD